jgi:hypothetical protein
MTTTGYDRKHRAVRARWAPIVATGSVPCSRCGWPILPGQAWHLDHDDHDRTRYLGPSHAHCNMRAGGKVGSARRWARRPRTKRPVPVTSRAWVAANGLPKW